MKFKVWCLSWDDTEDDACSVESGKIGEDAETSRIILDWTISDAESAAERYADYCHGNRDGWEASWPLVFRVLSEDGSVQDFVVDRDFSPEFTARKVAVRP